MDKEFQKYLVIFDGPFEQDCFFYTSLATSLKDCLMQFLSYIEKHNSLVAKALNGLDTEEEMIDLINVIAHDRKIRRIYKVDEAIYWAKEER